MLQDLLEDRFKLRAHRETRDMPIYTFRLAKGDRKLGEGLKPSSVDCAAIDLTFRPERMPQGPSPPGAPPLPSIDPNGPSLITAPQEQLGLNLERAPEVLVIDHVERPTPD
jgi:hypothetical protein